jgi:NTP pyrophosphatase (non-canonical NTP hydrolase)
MQIDEYAAWAAQIAKVAPTATPDPARLAYLGLGLTGEAGEVAELIKKLLRDGAWSAERIGDELGDVFYYLAALCAASGHRPSDILAASRAKIEARLKPR